MKKNGISRRDFLRGTAAGALSVAAAGLLGACAPAAQTAAADSTTDLTAAQTEAPDTTAAETTAAQTAAETAASEAPATDAGMTDWLGTAPVIDESQVVATYDAEVVVVGSGTAGLFAACAAVEEGAKTILIEKTAEAFGGSGIRDTLAAIGSRQQIANNDNPNKFDVITELYRQSNGYGNQKLYKVWADNSGEAIDWYTDRLAEAGVQFLHEVDDHSKSVRYPIYDVGHSIQWEDREYNPTFTAWILKDYATPLGLEIHYETALTTLIKEGDKVTGLYAAVEGGYARYNASKGVIVCTGGYSLNYDMLNALQPETVSLINNNSSFPGSHGDGIKACIWAGGKFDDVHCGMIFDRGAIKPDAVGTTGRDCQFWIGSQPFLKVDLAGNRFTNESGCYDHILHESLSLPGRTYCMIWDANYVNDIERFDTHGCSRMFPHANGTESVYPMGFYDAVILPQLREDGYVVSADTIEELAKKLGLPVDTFQATVDRYNELYDAGEDSDFGKEAYRLSELRTAPFEGVRMSGGYFICTMDGIKIDENMNVIDENGAPIEGLYCAGDCSGSYFATSYPNLLAGAAAGRSVTFGRLAGKNAAHRA